MLKLSFGSLIPLSIFVFACINTTYSRLDEKEVTNDVGHLVIGAFAHHGPAFYEHEVLRCNAILKKTPNDFDARNDLGAAYTKLGKFAEAQSEFEKNDSLHPERYETASNLGVLFKKSGEFERAAAWIEKALKIKPGGHMGLGDYYLKMIRWKLEQERLFSDNEFVSATVERVDPNDFQNFLGVKYSAGPNATAEVANREYTITLIKNDMSFPDAYVVLGDVCFAEADYQTALRCYHRAEQLDHPNYRAVRQRLFALRDVFEKDAKPGYVIEEMEIGGKQVKAEIAQAENWLESFQSIELQRLNDGKPVDFASMKVALKETGIEKPVLLEAAYYEGTAYNDTPTLEQALVALAILAAGLLIFLVASSGIIYFIFRWLTSRRQVKLKTLFAKP